MSHLDENANLRHGFVTVAKVVALKVDAALASCVSLRLFLLPNVEVNAMLRVIWFNLSAS
jgi:hypothetical protein